MRKSFKKHHLYDLSLFRYHNVVLVVLPIGLVC